jgi:hypothetical protein
MASIAAERLAVPSPVILNPNPANPGWMSNPWKVKTTSVPGVEFQDTLRLRANGTIEIQKSNSTQSTLWATSCMLSCAGLSGVTNKGNKPFLIQFDSAKNRLTCKFLSPGTNSLLPGTGATWVAEEGGAGSGSEKLPESPTGHSQG